MQLRMKFNLVIQIRLRWVAALARLLKQPMGG